MNRQYDHKELATEIRHLIKDRRLYRNIHFSREDIARELDILPARVSLIFRDELKTSFYDFVNRLRAIHAHKLLKSQAHKDDTLEDIAVQSGFNNRMTMHRVYVKMYGITPGEERKNNKQDNEQQL